MDHSQCLPLCSISLSWRHLPALQHTGIKTPKMPKLWLMQPGRAGKERLERQERERKEGPGWGRSLWGRTTSSHHELPTPTLFAWLSTDTFRMSLCCPLHGVSYRDPCQQLQGRTGMGTASRPCPNSLLFPTPPAIHILYLGIYLSLKRRWERLKVNFLAEFIYFQGIFDRGWGRWALSKGRGQQKGQKFISKPVLSV